MLTSAAIMKYLEDQDARIDAQAESIGKLRGDVERLREMVLTDPLPRLHLDEDQAVLIWLV
jgi:hypothetical protein